MCKLAIGFNPRRAVWSEVVDVMDFVSGPLLSPAELIHWSRETTSALTLGCSPVT